MTDEEFRAFIAARGSALRRTGFFLTGDWQLGEDLTQSALVATWRRLGQLRENAAIEAYVRTAMARTYLSWRRVRSFTETPTAPTGATGATGQSEFATDPAETVAAHDHVWAALQRLPPQQRAALVLRYYEDLPIETIAETLDTRPGTVKSSLSRGLRTLRHMLETDAAKEIP